MVLLRTLRADFRLQLLNSRPERVTFIPLGHTAVDMRQLQSVKRQAHLTTKALLPGGQRTRVIAGTPRMVIWEAEITTVALSFTSGTPSLNVRPSSRAHRASSAPSSDESASLVEPETRTARHKNRLSLHRASRDLAGRCRTASEGATEHRRRSYLVQKKVVTSAQRRRPRRQGASSFRFACF